MTDLNSSLTDFDKSLITEAPKPPELKPFSVWSEENQLAEADPQSYVQYSDYVREGYLDQGAYTPNVEEEISGSLNSKLADFGVVDEEGVQALTATKEPSFEEKFEYVRSSINSDEEDWKTLTDYKAGDEVVSAGGTVKPFQDKVAGLKERSEEIVNRRYDDVKRSLVESNQLPLAYVTNEEGQRELLVGDAAENMTVTQAIKASKLGGVSFKDGLVAQKLLSPIAGLDIKLYKFKKITEISEGIAELAQQDASVAEHITGHTRQLARKDRSAFDSVGATITRGVSDLLTLAGAESEESNAEKTRIFVASHESFDNTVEYITEKLNASGANYNTKDVRDAYESHVINEGAKRGVFKLHQDPSEAGKNLYNTALGPVLNPAVFAREEDMVNTLAAHPELTAQQKELFTKNRVDVLKQNFASYSKLLSESAVGDEWTKALVAGRQAGRDDLDVFDEFVAKDENFNEFTDSVKGIAYSVWDSVASLLYIAPAVMGADWAKDGLADASQRQSDRREVAQIFGEQYGLIQDVAESVAPLIVDVAATTALSSVTAGAGGAAYLTAKGGAQLTAKGLGKALTSNVLRASSKEGLEKVAGKAANVWIKESLETGGRAGTIKALQAYNSEVAKKFGVTVGTFVPAATRSGAMSYGSLYNQLRKDPDLTEEEAHDRALGFALTSGAITGVITSGFSALGRGGVEDALLKGMTFKESKKLFQAMGNTTGISNETVATAMKKVVGDSIKKYGATTLGKKVVKNVVDEGLEESVDQLVNSFVEDVALNQDTPMLERMKQVWHAAQVGGILGGGVPAVQAAASRLGVTPMDQLEQRIRMQNEFVEQVSSELEGTGSPLAARQVREIMMSRVRGRRPSAPAPEVPDTLTITEQKVKSEQNAKRAKRTQEIAQEISKLDDQSTLPKKAEEREAEVAQRTQRRVELEQEGVALSEEQQKLRALEEAPTTLDIPAADQKVTPEVFIQSLNEASPLDVETAFENIRNQQNISFNNSEDTTVLKIEDTEAPPATETPFDYGVKTPRKIRDYSARADIDFTREQANAESAGVSLQGESRTNIGSNNSSSRGFDPSVSKRYSSRPSSDTLRFDDPPFSGANAEEKAIKLIDFAIANGFPVNLDPNVNYGLPLPSGASRQSVSEFVSSAVYTAYPKLAPPKNAKPYTSKQTAKTYFDPVSGKTVRQKVKGFVDDSGNGIFDNDPIVMIDMLKSGKLVKVPRSFSKANINPAIRIKDGVVVDVVGPTADGNLLESKVVDARHVSPIEPNNTRAAIIASIPFKKAELPAGVKDFDPLNGGPKSEDFADTTTIKRRIGRFSLELEKTGEEANRRVQSRLESNSGELSPEFRMAALESAKQEFLFNAQLISLREKLLANPATIIDEVVAQTGSSNVNQAAQRLLPFIKVESNNNLTGSAILGLFVEQKLQNNPDFANNAPPTFDTLLAKAANRFKSQEETATSLRQQRAATTLPFDRTPSEFRNPKVSEWIANFGRNPEGDLASPEDISSAVSGAINTAIDAVNTDPDLRRAINKITLDHVLNDGTPEMADMVQTASARDIFGLFASWVSSGNGNTRESVTEFVEQLELGIYPSSAEFQNALLLVNLANRSDGASYENSDAVNAYRDLFNAGAKQEIDTDQARNTMIALTKAVRTHLSRSNISSAERSTITAQNESDIQRLKLESGNPESVIEALKDVSKNSDNPSHKVVADLLLLDTDFIKKVKFVLGSATADIAGKYVKGLDGSHTVFINKTSGNGRGLVNTLLEEYVHAFISDITSATDAQIEGMPKVLKTRLKSLSTVFNNASRAYEAQKQESGPVPALENALVDLNEFAAQFLLSEDVQKHVRSLVPPPNRSSFFSRFLTNIVMLFPKVGPKSAKEAAKALEDVLDVGSNTRKTAPTDPKVLGGSLAGKALFSSPVTRPKDRERAKQLRELQREAENARLEANSQEVEAFREAFLASVPEADRPKMGNLLNYVRGLLPLGMDMKITTESGGSSAFVNSDSSAIFVNPIVMLEQAGDISDIASRAIIGTIINEELTHTASFNALSMEEVQEYIDSLSESDFVDIAKEYHGDNDAALKTTLAQLNSEDPSVVADARYRMAEEKLRMHLQKVTRGFTTEDDIQFWKSKPSLLGMLGRYFRGIINRWVAKRRQIGPAADVALNKLIIEMRAIEVGFVRQPTKMAFNPENPMEAFRMFGTVNQDFVGLAETPQTMDGGESYLTPEQAQNLKNVRSGKSQVAPDPIHSEFSPVSQAADNLANGFNLSNGTSVTLERGENGSVLFEGGGRAFVVVNVNGSRVGFYQSTGDGGKVLQSGKWYPTAGLEKGGMWLNKTNSEGMATYYGSRALAEIASKLDNTLGNVKRFVLRTDDGSAIRDIRSQQGTAAGVLPSPEIRARINPDGRETFSDDDGRVHQAVKDLAAEFDSAAGMESPRRSTLYSAPVADAEYMAAVESGDVEAQQRMVDEAAKAAGYISPKVYHGTTPSSWDTFRVPKEGAMFATRRTMAELFGDGRTKKEHYKKTGSFEGKPAPRIIEVYLKPNNLKKAGLGDFSRLNAEGVDTVVFEDSVWIVGSPNQIKSADPITRDADGNVIPLSQRFDEKKSSILYSAPSSQFKEAEKVLTEADNTLNLEQRETLYGRKDIKQRDGGSRTLASAASPAGGRGARSRSGRSGRTAETPLADAPTIAGISGGIPKLIRSAESYAKRVGIDHRRQSEYATIDKDFSERLAKAYDEMDHDPNDPEVAEAYSELIRQVRDQYDELVSNGYEFWFIDPDKDPYEGKPWRAMADLRNNDSMGVFPTTAGFGTITEISDNPLEKTDTGLEWSYGSPDGPKKPVLANDLFRAVHDAFGHGLEGSGFRAQGEENAWQAHVRLFYGSAVHAMTSETRGQNSWLNFGPYGEKNQKALIEDTTFADQKTGLMPSWAWTERVSPDEPVILGSAPVDTDQPVAGFPPLFSERTGKLLPIYDQSKDPTKQLRPEGQAELARRLAFGRITPEEYQEEYDRRFGAPEMSEDIPKPATQKEIFDALRGESKKSKTSLPEDVPADRYKVRLDIPAYTRSNVWVVTLHEDTSEMTPLAYTPSAVLDNVTFSVNQKAAAGIALKTGKGSIATMDGDYQPLPAKEAESLAKEAMNSTEWVEIGMNPYRHSYFYDKANQEPLVSAEQVIQVGGTVFAKGAKFGNRTETLEDGSRRFLYSAPLSAAPPSGQPTGTGIDFSAVVDLLEAPVYEIETGQPKNFITKFLTEMFAGRLPEAFRRLVQNRDAYKRLTESNVIAYKTEMDKLIKATYGSYDNAPMEMIARAQGYYSGNVVTEEVLNGIEEAYDKAHAAAEADRKAGNITKGEADTLKSIADKIRTNDTNKAYDAAVKVREADRDAALRDLAKESPKLAAHIIDIREKLIIPLQKKLVKSGLDSKIGVKISKTGGIYVTRSYQMFTDSSYLEKVKTDPKYQKVRDAAMKFFKDEFLKKTTKDLVNSGMDPSLAKIEAGKILERENQSSPHNSYGQEALNAFLMQYEKGGRDSTTLAPKDYKMIEDNLKRRRDLPEEIRNLLGELGPKSGIDLILRTYSTVATLTSQQAFLNQLKDFGVKSGVMVTTENRFATKENRDKYSNFVPARSGVPSKSDPLSGMHVSPEFKEALDVTLKDSYMMDYADTAEKAVKGMFGLASNLSGKAMAAKTLGSIGFYGRNAVGNLLFGTSQGFFRYDKMIAAMTKSSIAAFTGASGKIDPVVSELIGLNVMGDELRAGVMRDLLNGKVTPEGIRKQIAELGEKTKLNKLTKGLAIIEKKAQDLSAALDAAYKVAYYNHELNILKEAQAVDTGDFAGMSETKIKRLAARKVVMTSQAYSQAPPAVAAFTKSGLGLVFAPFIRFKMEVPRIVINTFKLAKEEIDSKNPVLVRRGRLRMGSMIGTLGVLSSAVPMIMAALSGIGDEEDEAMRASIPDYLRGHTFFYFGKGKNLKSIDLTYVNPYSLIVDPFLRSYENIRRGEFTEAGAALAIGFVRDQYLDDQILSGAVRDATRNLNPSTGKPIWNNGADGPVEAGSKILSYIAKEAYAPRLGKDFVNGWATGSLFGMVGEIADGAMPARIHDIDLQKQYSRYLLDLNKRFNNVKSGLNAVKRNAPMSDGEVADIIDDNIEDRRLLNYELMRINKGFGSLGLTNTDLLKGMKEMKLGRDRVALLSRGYMDRPPPKYIIESLLDPRTDEYGEGRAQQILNHYRNINRYIPIRPITESE